MNKRTNVGERWREEYQEATDYASHFDDSARVLTFDNAVFLTEMLMKAQLDEVEKWASAGEVYIYQPDLLEFLQSKRVAK